MNKLRFSLVVALVGAFVGAMYGARATTVKKVHLLNETPWTLAVWGFPSKRPPILMGTLPAKRPGVKNAPGEFEWPTGIVRLWAFRTQGAPDIMGLINKHKGNPKAAAKALDDALHAIGRKDPTRAQVLFPNYIDKKLFDRKMKAGVIPKGSIVYNEATKSLRAEPTKYLNEYIPLRSQGYYWVNKKGEVQSGSPFYFPIEKIY